MNVTSYDYEKLSPEGRKLYETITNYLNFETTIAEIDSISFQDKISNLKEETDRTLIRDFLLSRTEN